MSIDFKNKNLYELTRYLIIEIGKNIEKDITIEYKKSEDGIIFMEVSSKYGSIFVSPDNNKILISRDTINANRFDIKYYKSLAEDNPYNIKRDAEMEKILD